MVVARSWRIALGIDIHLVLVHHDVHLAAPVARQRKLEALRTDHVGGIVRGRAASGSAVLLARAGLLVRARIALPGRSGGIGLARIHLRAARGFRALLAAVGLLRSCLRCVRALPRDRARQRVRTHSHHGDGQHGHERKKPLWRRPLRRRGRRFRRGPFLRGRRFRRVRLRRVSRMLRGCRQVVPAVRAELRSVGKPLPAAWTEHRTLPGRGRGAATRRRDEQRERSQCKSAGAPPPPVWKTEEPLKDAIRRAARPARLHARAKLVVEHGAQVREVLLLRTLGV